MAIYGSINAEANVGLMISSLCIAASLLTSSSLLPTVITILRERSTLKYPPYPFFTMSLGSFLWLCYGCLIQDIVVIVSNTLGCIISIANIISYCRFSRKEAFHTLLFLFAIKFSVIFTAIFLVYFKRVNEVRVTAIVLFFAFLISPLLVIKDVVKAKTSESMSLFLSLAILLNGMTYTSYGILVLADVSLWLTGIATIIIACIQILCITCFRSINRTKELEDVTENQEYVEVTDENCTKDMITA